MRMGGYESAINSFFNAFELYKSIDRNDRASAALINIGVLYKKQEQYDLALDYYRKALHYIGTFHKSEKKKAVVYNNIGIIHRHKKNYDSAQYYYNQSINYNLEIARPSGLADNYSNIATLFQDRGAYDSALQYFNKALEIRHDLKDTFGILHAQWQMGATLMHKADLNRGVRLYYRIKSAAEKNNYTTLLTGIYQDLYEYHKTMNRTDSALYYLESHEKIETSLKNAEISEMLAQRNDALLRGENESLRELTLLQKELLAREKTYNLTLLAAVCFLLLLSGILFLIFNENRKKAKVLMLQKEKISDQNKTIETANRQLSLVNKDLHEVNSNMEQLVSLIAHDMKSPVDQVKGLVELLRMEMHEEELQRHADFFQHIATVTDRQYQLINSIITGYRRQGTDAPEGFEINAEVSRLAERYSILANNKGLILEFKQYTASVIANFDKEKFVRIVENLLSNALKYSPKGGVVSLNAKRDNNTYLLTISDQGPGIPVEKQRAFEAGEFINPDLNEPESHGVGLSIVHNFSEALGIDVRLESSPEKGTTFTLKIPI